MPSGIHSLIPGPEDSGEPIAPTRDRPPIPLGVESALDGEVEGVHRDIPTAAIRANAHQPRTVFDDAALDNLAASIRSVGVLQPILVRRVGADTYELIAGERRWRAAQRAGLTSIPAIVRDVDDERSLEEALVENVQRQDLNAIDEAFAYQQLMEDFGLSQNEVATRVGKSRASIANTIRLLQLPGSLRQLVSDGDLTAGHGRALLMIDDTDEQFRIAGECIKGAWSVRDLEAVVRKHEKSTLRRNGAKPSSGPRARRRGGKRAGKPVSSTAALEVESQLGDLFHTPVEVVEKGSRKQLVIEFADAEDLARIVAIITDPRRPE